MVSVEKIEHPKNLQLSILGTQFLSPRLIVYSCFSYFNVIFSPFSAERERGYRGGAGSDGRGGGGRGGRVHTQDVRAGGGDGHQPPGCAAPSTGGRMQQPDQVPRPRAAHGSHPRAGQVHDGQVSVVLA